MSNTCEGLSGNVSLTKQLVLFLILDVLVVADRDPGKRKIKTKSVHEIPMDLAADEDDSDFEDTKMDSNDEDEDMAMPEDAASEDELQPAQQEAFNDEQELLTALWQWVRFMLLVFVLVLFKSISSSLTSLLVCSFCAFCRRTMTPRCVAFVWDDPQRLIMSLSTATLSTVPCVFIKHATVSKPCLQKASHGCVIDARLLLRKLW